MHIKSIEDYCQSIKHLNWPLAIQDLHNIDKKTPESVRNTAGKYFKT